jgi:hypothetical protein
LVGRREGNRTLVKYRNRWEDNIKVCIKEAGYDGTNSTRLPLQQRALVNKVINSGLQQTGTIFSIYWAAISLSRKTQIHGVSDVVITDIIII